MHGPQAPGSAEQTPAVRTDDQEPIQKPAGTDKTQSFFSKHKKKLIALAIVLGLGTLGYLNHTGTFSQGATDIQLEIEKKILEFGKKTIEFFSGNVPAYAVVVAGVGTPLVLYAIRTGYNSEFAAKAGAYIKSKLPERLGGPKKLPAPAAPPAGAPPAGTPPGDAPIV